MKRVTLAVARTCPYRQVLTKYFEDCGIPYGVEYIEDNEEFRVRHSLAGSPSVLVNNEVVCRGMPSPEKLDRIRLICGLPPGA
jgi:predicted thioredoxin/glutaredoxin